MFHTLAVFFLLFGIPMELARGEIDMGNLTRVHNLFLLTATIAMEAEGESYQGKLAVAYVILNRAYLGKRVKPISEVVFTPRHFSAWNTRGGRQLQLDSMDHVAWSNSERAAVSAYYRIEPDPTHKADHYLNVKLTRKLRGGSLPRWVSKLTKTVKIGKHTFYREER